MKRFIGIGGIFFKANDPQELGAWYKRHLGLNVEEWGGVNFQEGAGADLQPKRQSHIVWSPFEANTDYFAPSEKPFMINHRVHALDALLTQLRSEGVEVAGPASGGQLLQEQGSARYWSISRRGWATQLIGTIGCPLGAKQVDPKTEKSEFGYFGWIMDPEGNRIELWEPPALKESDK